jgi:hypothetical protein
MIRRFSELVPLQGFNPCKRLLSPSELFVRNGNSRPSWASSSLGVLSSCRRVFLGTRPLVGFSPLAPAAAALQSLPRKKLRRLSRVNHPFRGLSPSQQSRFFADSASLGCPSETVRCYHLPDVSSSIRLFRCLSSPGQLFR